ncbi:hypothetical protein ACQ4PT_045963 [Festuca glaucescens]
MLDFDVEMLGDQIAVRSTESAAGSGEGIRLGKIAGVDGGSGSGRSPASTVYKAEILDVDSDQKNNRGVKICHLDTSDWSPNHGAFVTLVGKPGGMEVCHWIFQGDMTWTVAD